MEPEQLQWSFVRSLHKMQFQDYGVKMEHNWDLYTLYRNGKPYKYRFGEPWVAQQLLIDGGYDTPEEAKKAWLRYIME